MYAAVFETKAVLWPDFLAGQLGSAENTALGEAKLAYQAMPAECPEQLAAELARVKEEGVALDLEDSEAGVCCVGVSVLTPTVRPVAAPGPIGRVDQARMERAIPPLCAAAIKIAITLAGPSRRQTPWFPRLLSVYCEAAVDGQDDASHSTAHWKRVPVARVHLPPLGIQQRSS